jgi:hypothetical protein
VITPDSLASPQPIPAVLATLSRSVVDAQQRLDTEHARDLDAFAVITRLAAGTDFETFAQSLAPTPFVITDADIDCRFTFTKTVEGEFSIRVLNAAWTSRFQTSSGQQQSFVLNIKRVPASPGSPISGGNQ